MQFYMLDADPIKSAKLLPDYALFKVNLREGWQILSDIGHIFGVTWPEQNALYSESHALTRMLCSTQERFNNFLQHYEANLTAYRIRTNILKCTWRVKYENFRVSNAATEIRAQIPNSEYDSTRIYLLTTKRKHLTAAEIERLTNA
jgi:hypothetical protein